MCIEYGIFADEGLLEGGFYSEIEAQDAVRERYTADDDVTVLECCRDHPDEARAFCARCMIEDEDDTADDEFREDEEDDAD